MALIDETAGAVANIAEIPSPALLVFEDRLRSNVAKAIAMIGNARRLRPHVKTHKMREVVQMHLAAGVTRFKCATIAEAEMAAAAGAPDVLLAYQPAGPNVTRMVELTRRFPETRFSTIVDDPGAAGSLAEAFARSGQTIEALLDVNCGMNRTGISPGDEAGMLYRRLTSSPGLRAGGLHAYDGHIHDSDVAQRETACASAMAPVRKFRQRLEAEGLSVPRLVAGGTPTFPVHARHADAECSPGTYVFWDFGYAETMPDLPFTIAALLLTRVTSKPAPRRLCLDLGHKAVAAENPPPRVKFPRLPDAVAVMHSEEHLVIETERASEFRVGDPLLGVPRHICPTVALHGHAVIVRGGRAVAQWKVLARDRVLTV